MVLADRAKPAAVARQRVMAIGTIARHRDAEKVGRQWGHWVFRPAEATFLKIDNCQCAVAQATGLSYWPEALRTAQPGRTALAELPQLRLGPSPFLCVI